METTTIGRIHFAQNHPEWLREIGCVGMVSYCHSEDCPVERTDMPGGFMFQTTLERLPWHRVWSMLEELFSDTSYNINLIPCIVDREDGHTRLFVFLNPN